MQYHKHMNDLISDLFPSLSGQLNDLTTNTIPDTKKDGRCDAPKNRFFSGHSTTSCKPLEGLVIKGKNSHGHQQSKPKKQKLTINSKKSDIKIKLIKSIISAQNTSTHSKKSESVTLPPQTENDKLLKKREKERIRKANYRKTKKGRAVERKASKKYRSSEKGKKKSAEYREEYKKTPKGILSSAVSNVKSNTTTSALKKGCSMREARIAGEEAAEDEKADLLEVFNIPWLQTQPR